MPLLNSETLSLPFFSFLISSDCILIHSFTHKVSSFHKQVNLVLVLWTSQNCYNLGTKGSNSFFFSFLFFFSFFFFFCFLGLHPEHMEIPRLVVESELQLPAYITATATRDPSHVCDLHHSSGQHQIPDPLNKTRDGICILMDTSWICLRWATIPFSHAPYKIHVSELQTSCNSFFSCST